MVENEDKKDKIEIKIVRGNSKDLNISDVKDNLTFEVHDNKATKNGDIVIPENQKKKDD